MSHIFVHCEDKTEGVAKHCIHPVSESATIADIFSSFSNTLFPIPGLSTQVSVWAGGRKLDTMDMTLSDVLASSKSGLTFSVDGYTDASGNLVTYEQKQKILADSRPVRQTVPPVQNTHISFADFFSKKKE